MSPPKSQTTSTQTSSPSPSSPPRRRFWTPHWEARDVAPLISLAVMAAFFAAATADYTGMASLAEAPGRVWWTSAFLRITTLEQILSQGAVLAIVSAGLTFVLLCGEIDLAVGMSALLAACCCGWLLQAGHGVAASLVAPLVLATSLGAVGGGLTNYSKLPSFIISLAMMFIAQGLAQYITRGQTFAVPEVLKTIGNSGWSIPLGTEVNHKGVEIERSFITPYSTMIAAAIMLLGHLVLTHTPFGRWVYMTGGARTAARLAGVRCGLVVVAVMTISAAAAGVGGLVNAGRLHSASMDQNADLLLAAVACVVLGGTSLFGGEGSMPKTVVGVVTFTVLRIGLIQIRWIDDNARQLLTGCVLMAALVMNGLLAKKR